MIVGPALGDGAEPLILLGDGLHAEKRRLDQELRDVRSLNVAVAREQSGRGTGSAA